MNLKALRTESRRKLDDRENGGHWTDEELNDFANDAVRQAAINGRLKPVSIDISVAISESDFTLPAHVFHTDQFIVGTNQDALMIKARSQMERDHPGWRDWSTGIPDFAVIDPGSYSLTLAPAPSAATTLTVIGYAVPSESEQMTSDTDEPAIPEIYHRALVHWICAEALDTPDADKGDPQGSERHRILFERRFGATPSADQLQTRSRQRGRSTRAVWF